MIRKSIKKLFNSSFFGKLGEAYIYFKKFTDLNSSRYSIGINAQIQEIKPNTIYVHELSGLIMLYKALKLNGKDSLKQLNIVYDCHELEEFRNPPKPWLIRLVIKKYEIRIVQELDCQIVTVSENIAALLSRKFKRPVSLIKNHPSNKLIWEGDEFTNQEISSYIRRPMRGYIAKSGGDASLPLGVIIGKLTVNRGIEETLNAMMNSCAFNLVLVGPFTEKMHDRYSAHALRLGISERVFIIDSLPNHEVVRYISDANFSILPIIPLALSYYYCSPNKLHESFAAKLPIIYNGSTESDYLVDIKEEVNKIGVGVAVDFLSPISSIQLTSAIKRVMNGEFNYPDDYETVYFDARQNLEIYRHLLKKNENTKNG